MDDLIWWTWVGSLSALVFAFYTGSRIMRRDEGTDAMKEISMAIRTGANAYLKRQYTMVAIFFTVMVCVFALMAKNGLLTWFVPFAFVSGGFFSGLSGFIGMKVATFSNARTAWAARESLNSGLRVAFGSGTIMGMTVVALALIDITAWYLILKWWATLQEYSHPYSFITANMLTFGMGASSMALFARLGGGIFTKAADVGADIVGKIEAGIPEDDPRNPAVIADNVGDNVGDVAGMGADLYESYVGSIVAAAALGAASFTGAGLAMQAVTLPLLIASLGVICSIIGSFQVKAKNNATQGDLLGALRRGIWVSTGLIILASYFLVMRLLDNVGVWVAIVTGLVAGNVIGYFTEYFTSDRYAPTKYIASQAETGHATVVIAGIATGMLSTAIPVVTVVAGILISFFAAGGGQNVTMGLYGIAVAAVGMLSTLGITLATDAYGPVADNAGGCAEMAGLEPKVRERTDALDMLGNTTAATGKGFAIGSAALTALALLAAYQDQLQVAAKRLGVELVLNIDLMNPKILCGLLLGAMMPYVFSALSMRAVGRAAGKMVAEVRRQFRAMPGILKGTQKPDYASCVTISTKAAQQEMVLPSLLAIVVPILVGVFAGPEMVLSLLCGGTVCGFVLAVMMANAGGAWDNAKKHIEGGAFGGKGSDAHKAGVTGDTVGDPFKDTSGPALNILIKLMTMVSLVFAALVVKCHGF